MKLNKPVRDLLRDTAPTLLAALALPPPLNMIASGVVAPALDHYLRDDKTEAEVGGVPVENAADPEAIIRIVETNAADPDFARALRSAESDLQKYELETGIRFRKLELQDRTRAGNLQISAGIGRAAFDKGMILVWIALITMGLLIAGLLLIAFRDVPIKNPETAVAAFGLIGTVIGFINGIAGTVITFYWGSSQGSKDKTDAISASMRELGSELARTSERNAVAATNPSSLPRSTATAEVRSDPATPAGFELSDVVPDLRKPHAHFPDGVTWELTADGISVDGAKAARTNGAPDTVTRIWDRYGNFCANWARSYGVPVELIVAAIATESKGDKDARRQGPNDVSVGLMQTPLHTARGVLGRPSISADDLVNPSLSIEAGTAYIAQQRNETNFDPPLVAAAYNVGSLRKDTAEANKWRLHCHPPGTGRHVTRFVEWFGDAMRVSRDMDWSDDGEVPSFAATLQTHPR